MFLMSNNNPETNSASLPPAIGTFSKQSFDLLLQQYNQTSANPGT